MGRLLDIELLLAVALCGQSLEGVVDLHVHCDPDSMPRASDAFSAARLARDAGLRAVVLKNHFEPTASMAWLARAHLPGVEVFGGIVLNRAGGGINRIVVTHAMFGPIDMKLEEVREAARLGAYPEFAFNAAAGPDREAVLTRYAKAIRSVGPQHCILTSDLGQPGNPMPTEAALAASAPRLGRARSGGHQAEEDQSCSLEALRLFFDGLRARGLTAAEIEQMAKVNPARLLGLR